jgi:hypothetical protein
MEIWSTVSLQPSANNQVGICCTKPLLLFKDRGAVPLETRDRSTPSVLELIMECQRQGWKFDDKSTELPVITQANLHGDGRRYRRRRHMASERREYFTCLVKLDALLAAGLKEFYHDQPLKYYGIMLKYLAQGRHAQLKELTPKATAIRQRQRRSANAAAKARTGESEGVMCLNSCVCTVLA